ncbi:hypothetical protein COH21_004903 [Aspergillus flavus]|nr:hypothetical protein COH21_004903 [Aspergillus flavus]
MSFRESASGLDEDMVRLARAIHGCPVPHMRNHGVMKGSDPPLNIYTMPLLPGVACLETLSCQADMGHDEEAKHIRFIKHLARYFARCWSTPQPMEPRMRAQCRAGVFHRLAVLKASRSTEVPISIISELETTLPLLFASEYPQVLTHGDLSYTNVLVNPNTYEITGIVDWSLAEVQPFVAGTITPAGRSSWRPSGTEFWTVSGIEDDSDVYQDNIRSMAETAAKLGAILRYAFNRRADGGPSEVLSTSDAMLGMLKAWLDGKATE